MRASSLDSVSTDLDDVCGKHNTQLVRHMYYHQQETDVGLNYHKSLLLDIGLQSIQFTNACASPTYIHHFLLLRRFLGEFTAKPDS